MKNVMQCKELFDYNLAYAVCQYVVTKKKQLKYCGNVICDGNVKALIKVYINTIIILV